MNSEAVMILRRPADLLMVVILLDVTCEIWMLPGPTSVSMESVNMRHVLRWSPLQAPCNTTVLYSVQYQGRFELEIQNGSWVDAPECQHVPRTFCDLTLDLGSDSDYNLRVRAQCGSQHSAWAKLSRPFNRKETVLTAPEMTVKTVADVLQVSFERPPFIGGITVTVWKKGSEQKVVYLVPAEQKLLHVAALQEGAVYCVRAKTVLDPQLHSSSTDAHCVSITGPGAAAWKRPTTVTVTVIVMLGLLFVLFWFVVHCQPRHCQTYFHKERLPYSLNIARDVQTLMRPQEEQEEQKEQEEHCEQITVLLDMDPPPLKPNEAFPAHLDQND